MKIRQQKIETFHSTGLTVESLDENMKCQFIWKVHSQNAKVNLKKPRKSYLFAKKL